jgi:hypothetical protein
MEPPPAPMLFTSTEGKPVIWPLKRGPIQVSLVQGMRPPRTRLTSVLVPPASAMIASSPGASRAAAASPATGAMLGPELTVWIGAAAASAAAMTPPWLVTTNRCPRNPAARSRASSPLSERSISGRSEASMQVAEARRYSRTIGLSRCERLTATPGSRAARISPTRISCAGLAIDHSRQTPTAFTASAASRSAISATTPTSSGRTTSPAAPIRSGTSKVSARGT